MNLIIFNQYVNCFKNIFHLKLKKKKHAHSIKITYALTFTIEP